jgi:tetratricopeptide (TPR) repeat protein
MANRFCSGCGAKLFPDARFCAECGQRQGGGRAGTPNLNLQRWAPLVVLLVVLIVGGATVYVGSQNPKAPPVVPPRAPQAAASGAAAPPMGADHPPLEIPAQVKEAIISLQQEAEKAPDDAQKWKHLADVQYRAAQIDRSYLEPARQSYARIVEKKPDDLDALRSLGNIAFDQEQPKVALDYYGRYLKQKPDDLEVRTDMGTMHLAAGDTKEAVRTYEEVLKTNPSFFQAQFNLAIAYRGAGQNEAAIAALHRAAEIAPDDTAKQQVQQLIARVEGQPAEPSPAAAAPAAGAPAGDFKTAIENIFRSNQVMASKVQKLEWTGPTSARLYLNDFPMTAMGDAMRTMFLDRMRTRFKEQKKAFGVTEKTTVELVDNASGQVMDTISE